MAESDQSWIPIKFETAQYLHPKYKCQKKNPSEKQWLQCTCENHSISFNSIEERRELPSIYSNCSLVDDCPQNAVEWVKRMELKKCNFIIQNCTTLDNFEYHCLTNKFQHIFVEVCAPNKMIVGKEYH